MGFPEGKGHSEPAAPRSSQLLSDHMLTLLTQTEENSQTRFAGVLELVWWGMDSLWGREVKGVGLFSGRFKVVWVIWGFLEAGPCGTCLVAQTIKNPPALQETWVQSLGWEDALEKGTAAHSSIPAWRIPWTEEPRGL